MSATLYDHAAERALLSAAARGTPDIVANMLLQVREDVFNEPLHAIAWRVMREKLEQALPWDWTLFKSGLKRFDVPDRDAEALTEDMRKNQPNADMWRHYATVVEDYYVRRRMDFIAIECRQAIGDKKKKAGEILSEIEARYFELHLDNHRKSSQPIAAFGAEAMQGFSDAAKRKGKCGIIATGFTDIDRLNIQGIRDGHLWVIGAPPGGGKTLFGVKIGSNIGAGVHDYTDIESEWDQPPLPVTIFSLEMSGKELAEREIVRLSRININLLQRGQNARASFEKLGEANKTLLHSKLRVLPTYNISVQDLRVMARYEKAKHGMRLMIVDYAQLLHSSTKSAQQNRAVEQAEVSKGLKQIAQELNIPVIALVQLQREALKGRPSLGHIGESIQYCKDADVIAFLSPWNSHEYEGKPKPEKNKSDASTMKEAFGDDDDAEQENDDLNYLAFDLVKTRGFGNTNGKPPLKIKWDREFFDLSSTCTRLFDPQGKTTQQY